MADANNLPILQMKKLKHRLAKELAQVHSSVRAGMCVPGTCL